MLFVQISRGTQTRTLHYKSATIVVSVVNISKAGTYKQQSARVAEDVKCVFCLFDELIILSPFSCTLCNEICFIPFFPQLLSLHPIVHSYTYIKVLWLCCFEPSWFGLCRVSFERCLF